MFSCYELNYGALTQMDTFILHSVISWYKIFSSTFYGVFPRKVGKLTSYEINCSFAFYYRKRPSVINGNIRTHT